MENPYWDAVRDHVACSRLWGTCVQRWNLDGGRFTIDGYPQREELVAQYAWAITDPPSLEFVAAHTRPDGLIDPMAGTGYWAYCLRQLGVDVVCYDANPCHENNPWHHEAALWVPVEQGYAEVVIDRHPDRVLLICWPPYSEPSANRLLREYAGHKVIYIGEPGWGCTADDDFRERLEAEWVEIAEHIPVQWEGLHDQITVYERKDTQVMSEDTHEVRELKHRLRLANRTMGKQGRTIAGLRGELARTREEHTKIERGELRAQERTIEDLRKSLGGTRRLVTELRKQGDELREKLAAAEGATADA